MCQHERVRLKDCLTAQIPTGSLQDLRARYAPASPVDISEWSGSIVPYIYEAEVFKERQKFDSTIKNMAP